VIVRSKESQKGIDAGERSRGWPKRNHGPLAMKKEKVKKRTLSTTTKGEDKRKGGEKPKRQAEKIVREGEPQVACTKSVGEIAKHQIVENVTC